MAPKTRAKCAKVGEKTPIRSRPSSPSCTPIRAREDDSKNTTRCCHCGASVRPEDTETTLQGTANAAANVSAAPLDSIEPVDPLESAEVPSAAGLPEWSGRRRRSALPTRDTLEAADFFVTEDFCSRWASGSAAATMVQMKKDPNYFTSLQKSVSSKT